MTLRETVEKRNRILTEARSLMTAADVTTETRAKVDAMLTDANVLKADIDRLEASAESEQRSLPAASLPREGFTAEGADTRTREERNKATNVALRSFLRGERFEQRDLTVAADGGVMIPVAAVEPVQAQRSAGSIMDIVRRMTTTTGEDVRVPLWDDTGNGFVLDSASVTTTDPSVTGITIKTDGLRSNPILLDNKLVADLSYDLVADVNASIQMRYTRSVSSFINAGNSSNFVGLTGNVPATLTSAVAASVGYADFVNLLAELDPAYAIGAAFSLSNATLGKVLGIKDSAGRPIFQNYLDGATSGFVGTILGFPVKINQYAPTVATGNVPILFGDHRAGYTLREVTPGVVIKQSNQRWIELNRLGVVAFARAGGAPTIASTTYSPLVGLTIS